MSILKPCKMILSMFYLCLFSCQILEADDLQKDPYLFLDSLAFQAGTDKGSTGKISPGHNYTRIYAKFFHALREKSIKFLEIGIQEGYSVKLWESYFPQAELHFIDITNEKTQYYSQRSHYHLIDQTDSQKLKALMELSGGDFDIILDDGGHTMNQQIVSFETLFPYIKSGGMYIIEDLHTSYWGGFGGKGTIQNPKAGPGTCVGFLQNLVDDLNYSAAVTTNADSNKNPPDLQSRLSYYQANIEAIHFYKSVCIIEKK